MKIIFLFTIVCLSFSLNAQHLTPKVESNLEKLLLEIKIDNGNRLSRVNSFINDKKISSDYDANYLNKKGHQIFDVQNGQPLFRKSFNNDAAAAMEVDAVVVLLVCLILFPPTKAFKENLSDKLVL